MGYNDKELMWDEYNNIHKKEKILGSGGQGTVYRTKDPNIALKIVTDQQGDPVTGKSECEAYSQKLKKVRLLPLPENLHISVPMALLKGTAGYVMRLLTDMLPFSHFWLDGRTASEISMGDVPVWLQGVGERAAKELIHYIKTGGLRRRLTALSKCASIITKLHANGFVYCDISANNIFISEEWSSSEVWLIDADNLRFDVKYNGSSVYTPRYGAPELVQGTDCGRFRTDCHAFAVLAFYMLTLTHPFDGDLVENSDWADGGNDGMSTEEKANACLIPWIDDEEDDSNSTNKGLPRVLVLTDAMKKLFQETFGPGRTIFWRRPSIFHWAETLAQAEDLTILCPSCGMTWYYNKHGSCPYCDAKTPSHLVFYAYDFNEMGVISSKPDWTYVKELSDNQTPIKLPERVFQPFDPDDNDGIALSVSLNKKGILLQLEDYSGLEISAAYDNDSNYKFFRIYSSVQLPAISINTGFYLYVNGRAARLLRCSVVMEAEI